MVSAVSVPWASNVPGGRSGMRVSAGPRKVGLRVRTPQGPGTAMMHGKRLTSPSLHIAMGTSSPMAVSGEPVHISASQTVAVRAAASSSPEIRGRSSQEST